MHMLSVFMSWCKLVEKDDNSNLLELTTYMYVACRNTIKQPEANANVAF